MAKAAIVILAGNESHSDYGRLANALEASKEFAENDEDELELIFDGAGTQWIPGAGRRGQRLPRALSGSSRRRSGL